MEYYGKILCISKDDLTRDDRPDNNPENEYLAPIMTISCFDVMVYRKKLLVVRKGIGRGVTALVSVESLPSPYKEKVKAKYGNMSAEILRNWFGVHFEIDSEAMSFYSHFRFEDGKELTLEQQQEYTINASTLQAVVALMNDTKMQRAVMNNNCIKWDEMAGAISFYQKEFGHTLPLSPNRFKKKVTEFQKDGYTSLISKKFGNQNTRKVNVHIERLILGLAVLPNRPFNSNICDMYNSFVRGELQVFDPETGEIFSPEDFTDKKGNPLELSQSTINNYLNQPKNQLLIKNRLMNWSTYMHKERPHVHRHLPEFSFSKITMDDRDLPRKIQDGKIRPKVYYAYDVASGCVIGYSYKREKDVGLVVDCFRSMFRLILRNGWNCPAQVEVENHLMSQFREGFLKAGEVFDFVRFCAPLNSQEKHAEQFNGAKKRSIEHKNHADIGRFYAKNWKYQIDSKKISDSLNNTYEERKYYGWDELVADDMADVIEWNNSLHPNQKKYPNMTRWEVLKNCMNPNLHPIDEAVISRYIGNHVETSIRRNSYCRVNYRDFWLSSPDVLNRLSPNNYNVDAYYIPDEDGNPGKVFIFQNGRLIDQLKDIGTFNEADVEQTDIDRKIMLEQNKLISQHDALTKREAIKPLGIIPTETVKRLEQVESKAVEVPKDSEINVAALLSKYGGNAYKGMGKAAV